MYETYRKLRNSLGYKDSDVAKGTGITKSTFSDWKTGRSIPKMDKLKKIANYFNVSVDYLMTDMEIDTKEKYDKTTRIVQEILNNKSLQQLFNAAHDAPPEDLEAARALILALKKKGSK